MAQAYHLLIHMFVPFQVSIIIIRKTQESLVFLKLGSNSKEETFPLELMLLEYQSVQIAN